MNFIQVYKKAFIKAAFLVVLTMGIMAQANAQTPATFSAGVFDDPGFDSSGGTPSDGGPTVPFNSGMALLLLAAGVGYTTKKIRIEMLATDLQLTK